MPRAADSEADRPPDMLDRADYTLEFEEHFTGPDLDPDRWVGHYLPQWTTPERSAARYELDRGVLRLRIDADQPAWRLDDGEMPSPWLAAVCAAPVLALDRTGAKEASISNSGLDDVVPFAVEVVGVQVDGGQFGVGDLDAALVGVLV